MRNSEDDDEGDAKTDRFILLDMLLILITRDEIDDTDDYHMSLCLLLFMMMM